MNSGAGKMAGTFSGTILAIETTGSLCSVALAFDGRVFHRASAEGLRHLTSLVPMIDEVVSEAGLKPLDLQMIAVSAGPGSFTGIRIGVATARTLAQMIGIPLIKVPTLETFAYLPCTRQRDRHSVLSAQDKGTDTLSCRIACPVFDARREQIYAGAYFLEPDGRIMTLVNGGAYTVEDYLASLAGAADAFRRLARRVGGTEAKVTFDWMGDGVHLVAPETRQGVQDAWAVLRWAQTHGRPCSPERVEPIYMRKAEASRKLEEKLAMTRQGDRHSVLPWQDRVSVPLSCRTATEDDVYGMSVVERLSFGEPWLEQSIRDDLGLPYSDYVVCAIGSAEKIITDSAMENATSDRPDTCVAPSFIAAYAGLYRIAGEGNITNIAVHPSVRRKGIGTRTLCELIRRSEAEGIDSFTLEVRASDAGAVDFYEKLGFKTEGRRKDYYVKLNGGGREDALILWRRADS
jgi:tRNA threonylcarbamoyl adenosine modification protein YeaZ